MAEQVVVTKVWGDGRCVDETRQVTVVIAETGCVEVAHDKATEYLWYVAGQRIPRVMERWEY